MEDKKERNENVKERLHTAQHGPGNSLTPPSPLERTGRVHIRRCCTWKMWMGVLPLLILKLSRNNLIFQLSLSRRPLKLASLSILLFWYYRCPTHISVHPLLHRITFLPFPGADEPSGLELDLERRISQSFISRVHTSCSGWRPSTGTLMLKMVIYEQRRPFTQTNPDAISCKKTLRSWDGLSRGILCDMSEITAHDCVQLNIFHTNKSGWEQCVLPTHLFAQRQRQ